MLPLQRAAAAVGKCQTPQLLLSLFCYTCNRFIYYRRSVLAPQTVSQWVSHSASQSVIHSFSHWVSLFDSLLLCHLSRSLAQPPIAMRCEAMQCRRQATRHLNLMRQPPTSCIQLFSWKNHHHHRDHDSWDHDHFTALRLAVETDNKTSLKTNGVVTRLANILIVFLHFSSSFWRLFRCRLQFAIFFYD